MTNRGFLLSSIVTLGLFASSACDASEVFLTPSCRMDSCIHPMIKDAKPVQILSNGTVVEYSVAYIEKKCSPDDDYEKADCFVKRPSRDDYKNFRRALAICSTRSPSVSRSLSDTHSSRRYLNSYLDLSAPSAGFQLSTRAEYLAVCHGWEPNGSDIDAQYIEKLGYKALGLEEAQSQHDSEAEAFQVLKAKLAQPQRTYVGRWYDGKKISVCKAEAGSPESEGLIIYTEKEMIGLENRCRITKKTVRGAQTQLGLRCFGEGSSSADVETVELVGDRLKRIVQDGRKRFEFFYSRCPR